MTLVSCAGLCCLTIFLHKLLKVLCVVEMVEGYDRQITGFMLCPPLHHGRHHKDVPMSLGGLQPLQHAQLCIHYSLPKRLCAITDIHLEGAHAHVIVRRPRCRMGITGAWIKL